MTDGKSTANIYWVGGSKGGVGKSMMTVAMALGRVIGDRVIARFGPGRVLRAGGAAAAGGLALAVGLPSIAAHLSDNRPGHDDQDAQHVPDRGPSRRRTKEEACGQASRTGDRSRVDGSGDGFEVRWRRPGRFRSRTTGSTSRPEGDT